jgi:autotransporter-associated beta strand protein
MTDTTWQTLASGDYNDPANWNPAVVPNFNATAHFGASSTTNVDINVPTSGAEAVDGWVFDPTAPLYNFAISGNIATFEFIGAGIVGARLIGTEIGLSISVADFTTLLFLNNSTAGLCGVTNNYILSFQNYSNAGHAVITNGDLAEFRDDSSAANAVIYLAPTNGNPFAVLNFYDYSTAANALIVTHANGDVVFWDHATGGAAELDTDAGGYVDFSSTTGPNGDGRVSARSISGGGNYYLGADQLTVEGFTNTVGGAVSDGGVPGDPNANAVGGSLVIIGPGSLTLSHPHNTYSGGTTLRGIAVFDVAALGAAGTGAITFAGHTTLRIENAALDGHAFDNPIIAFAKHDVIDLAGLHFHAGATARYVARTHHLTVHSGHVTDVLTLLHPHGMHFVTAGDGHGGTDVLIHA